MTDFLIGLMLGSATGFLIGLVGRHRLLARGGNIGTNQLIFNEGRTIRGNGNGGPTTPKPDIIPMPQCSPPLNRYESPNAAAAIPHLEAALVALKQENNND